MTAQRMSEAPTISVLLPVYSAERYLRGAIDSILAQTFSDFELLALDDGSTDQSLGILREYESKDIRIRVISRENRGLVSSLNELISESRGRYLARMDSDDVCYPKRFERQIEFLESNPNYVVIGGAVLRVNSNGLPIGPILPPCEHDQIDGSQTRGHSSIWHPTVMMRKDAVLKVGGYRNDYQHAEDLDLWLRLGEIGKLANLPEVVLRFRLHENSISQKNVLAQREAAIRACQSAWDRRGITETYEPLGVWRPTDKNSVHRFAIEYGWIAWGNGFRETWMSYAKSAIHARPFSLASWRLAVFGFLRHPPQT
jgi:glycosyltransferase involved in cell wall biosynthesis